MGFGDAVASAGPYANNLHLAPDRQTNQNLITQSLYRPDALPDAQPTVSKHWRHGDSLEINIMSFAKKNWQPD